MRLLSLVLSVSLALAPVQASAFGDSLAWVKQEPPRLYAATCQTDDTNQTTYAFTVAPSGLNDQAKGIAVVGVMGEDGAAAFSASTVTVDSQATTIYGDEGGTGVVDSALAVSGTITGAASLSVSVTFSEAIQAAVVCVWFIENLHDNFVPWGARANKNTASNIIQVRIGDAVLGQLPRNGFTLGVCAASGTGNPAAWTGLIEIEDADTAEFEYTNASVANAGTNPSVASCDFGGSNDAVASAIAFGDIDSAKTVIKYNATCVADTANATTYTFNGVSITGLSDTTPVLIVVGAVGEDETTDFNAASARIEGAAASLVHVNGKANLVDAATFISNGEITNAASVDITVTYSEAITAAAVCVWAFENLAWKTAIVRNGQGLTAAGTTTIPLHAAPNGGYAIGVCATENPASTISWTGLTEVDDVAGAEFRLSKAEAATIGGSLEITCVNSADDQSSSDISLR